MQPHKSDLRLDREKDEKEADIAIYPLQYYRFVYDLGYFFLMPAKAT